MNLQALKQSIPDFAKDIRLNLDSVLSETGAPGLSSSQIWMTALASAITSRYLPLTAAIEAEASRHLEPAALNAAKSAAAVMAMNNVYYRFTHLVSEPEYATLPARLRMNVLANPGVPKADFELVSLAVSAINGCGMCMDSHEQIVRKHDFTAQAVQSAVRIAATIHAAAVTLEQAQAAELAASALAA